MRMTSSSILYKPSITSFQFALQLSLNIFISFRNESLVAKKVFAMYLISSADSKSVSKIDKELPNLHLNNSATFFVCSFSIAIDLD